MAHRQNQEQEEGKRTKKKEVGLAGVEVRVGRQTDNKQESLLGGPWVLGRVAAMGK